jgi:ClpP class serine protease
MYTERKVLLQEIEEMRKSKTLLYVTGDRKGCETQIHPEVLDLLIKHLDKINKVSKISLILYTQGGHTSASWSIVNLIRQFCDNLEVILPSKGLSAGTLVCLGADTIVMTKQATLGPIDPSINTPLNPSIPGAPSNASKFPVSVEAINGYIELAKSAGIEESNDITEVFKVLTQHVNPLVLGEVYRIRTQIRMLGRRLLELHSFKEDKIDRILQFLCSESGSHDYRISRSEARDVLGLNVEKPDDSLYNLISALESDFAEELELSVPFIPPHALGDKQNFEYNHIRALVESVDLGSHQFTSCGILSKIRINQNNMSVIQIQDTQSFEGWRLIQNG